ncbi:glycogen phosphorylase 1-like isoform X4 [Salvia splendens]|uniref:glycogen phosphorylase 1-like isoform X4 n=1 Tax=Salvia splendens TaxID=180675 RepID=UPI001C254E71|nr:glycogen phosphorylase 1-like isoform X4 [Salvia splendens]
MAATPVSPLAPGLPCAEPYIRSTPNLSHRRSVLFNSEPKHFNHAFISHNVISKHPRASTASQDTDFASDGSSTVAIENDDVAGSTVFVIRARNRIGLLGVITRVFKVLGLTVQGASVEFEGDFFVKSFHVTSSDGKKLEDVEDLERIRKSLMEAIDGVGDTSAGLMQAGGRGVVVKKSVSGLESLGERRAKAEKMFGLMDGFLKNDPMSLQKDILDHVEYTVARSRFNFDDFEAFQEGDAALGNGGLARLSACQMDSLATLDYPVWGYGLRYQYGLFRQVIVDGYQHEQPDYWLNFGNPWEIERIQVSYSVKFYGTVEEKASNGVKYKVWTPGETVEAVAYDNPIPGYGTRNAINLRLWAAKPSGQYDLESYNTGDYINAIVNRQKAETISYVLYPDDRSYQGKELRLKQQYFFVSASVQDIIRRFKDVHDNFDEFPDKVAFQINDTHPSLAIVEVMRMLIDEECLDWGRAWEIVCRAFSFTTHTVNTEGLEKIPVDLLGSLLPRHLQIMYDINHRFMEDLKRKIGQDYSRLERMSIVEEGIVKSIRMANLSIICSHTVNGVSKVHFELLKTRLFKDFHDLWPQKFQYKTNGVTQRRWIVVSNPGLCSLISKWLGTEAWIRNVDLLAGLQEHASNPVLQQEWTMTKTINKMRLADYIETSTGVKVSLDAMFDVQVKRIHEYKRQLMNILGIVYRYDCIKNMNKSDRKKVVPRVCIIGGKAAPGYEVAKKIIKLCHAVAEKVNGDDDVGDLLKVVFIPDYNVSVAELVIPGSDLSQHISTVGHEASGTGSMKFLMNGCLLLATADGSTVEIIEEIGAENMFLVGAKLHEDPQSGDKPARGVSIQFIRVVSMVRDGYFGFKEYFNSLCDSLEDDKDFYKLGADFSSYLEAQAMADRVFVNKEKWTCMSILSTAGSGKFSSDRTIEEYAKHAWGIEPCRCPF